MIGIEIGGLIALGIVGIVGEKVMKMAGSPELGNLIYIVCFVAGSLTVIKWTVERFEDAFAWALGSH